jgi:cytoskeleton protein RodZ
MQTIGEKLEEARKRRGISIREASEVTKIRSEYLSNFESNTFDLPVPAIYVRGFLRSYAQFLKLNPEKVITDYNAHLLGESKFVRRESREFLGRMDLQSAETSEGEAGPETAVQYEAPQMQSQPQARATEKGFDYLSLEKSGLVKGAMYVGAAAVVMALAVIVVLAILKSGPADPTAVAQAGTPSIASATAKEITLLAEGGDIQLVIVTEVASGREIFRGALPAGRSQTIAYNDQVRLSYTHAQFLFIEHEGSRLRIEGSGPRQSTFPQRPRPQQL